MASESVAATATDVGNGVVACTGAVVTTRSLGEPLRKVRLPLLVPPPFQETVSELSAFCACAAVAARNNATTTVAFILDTILTPLRELSCRDREVLSITFEVA